MKRILVLCLLLCSCAHYDRIDHTPGHPSEPFVSNYLGRMLTNNGYSLSAIKYCIWDKSDIQATLTPDDRIVVTRGLLDATMSDRDILAFVLAHEVAHYKLRHIRNHQILSVGIWATLTAVDLVVPGVGLANHLINPLATRAFGRSQELDADREAINVLGNSGWREPKEIGIKTLTWGKQVSGPDSFFLWATHPAMDDRIENIKSLP